LNRIYCNNHLLAGPYGAPRLLLVGIYWGPQLYLAGSYGSSHFRQQTFPCLTHFHKATVWSSTSIQHF
jgi:hypothetical protein